MVNLPFTFMSATYCHGHFDMFNMCHVSEKLSMALYCILVSKHEHFRTPFPQNPYLDKPSYKLLTEHLQFY
jgi:hypothetical protein